MPVIGDNQATAGLVSRIPAKRETAVSASLLGSAERTWFLEGPPAGRTHTAFGHKAVLLDAIMIVSDGFVAPAGTHSIGHQETDGLELRMSATD